MARIVLTLVSTYKPRQEKGMESIMIKRIYHYYNRRNPAWHLWAVVYSCGRVTRKTAFYQLSRNAKEFVNSRTPARMDGTEIYQ